MFTKRLIVNTLCEFGPVLLFFAVYALFSFPYAVAAMMLGTLTALITLRTLEGHTPIFALISCCSILFFGGLSLFFESASFFIFRDTLFNIVMGTALGVSVLRGKPLFKMIFSNVFAITDRGWHSLSLRWAIFFFVLAVANETARFTLTPDEWVSAKAAIVLVTIMFGAYQFTLTRRERLPDASPWGIVR
jgi:intracellular septation protein